MISASAFNSGSLKIVCNQSPLCDLSAVELRKDLRWRSRLKANFEERIRAEAQNSTILLTETDVM